MPGQRHLHAGRGFALGFGVALLTVAGTGGVQASGLVQKWRAAVEGCVELVETGGAESLRTAGRTLYGMHGAVTFRHETGVMISARLPVSRPETVDAVCWLSYGSKIPGNDRRGQVLRETPRDFSDGHLKFHVEDQVLPPDIYRGCAWDGREFRLSSMTQTAYASFHIQLSPRESRCAVGTS